MNKIYLNYGSQLDRTNTKVTMQIGQQISSRIWHPFVPTSHWVIWS